MPKAIVGARDVSAETGNAEERPESISSLWMADDALLAKLGYKSEFRREFSV